MIMVWKKRTLLAVFLAIFVGAGLCGAAYRGFRGKRTFLPNEGRVVVMDAGHDATKEYHTGTVDTHCNKVV